MELARRDFVACAGAAAVALGSMAALADASAAEAPKEEKSAVEDPTKVVLESELAEADDNIFYRLPEGAEEPDYGARITHVFGASSLMDYYLFDGFTGIGIDEKNDTMQLRDLVMEPAGGQFDAITLKDGSRGDPTSLVRDVRGAVYTTPDGMAVNIKCQTLHGANPRIDGMVVYTTNKPGNLNKALKVPLSTFDGPLTRGMNYLLGNPDSGKHNTESKDNDGIDETSINFHYQEADPIAPGLQHIYTKYSTAGKQSYWLYVESANRFDVRTDSLGSGDPQEASYVPGTSLNMSVCEPVDGYHAVAAIDPLNPDRLCFSIPVEGTFYFDPEDPTVVQNASLTNEREFAFWRAEVGNHNTALQGDTAVSCELDQWKCLFFSVQCDEVVPGEFELAVSCSAGRGTGWPTEWSEKPAVIKVRVQ